MYRPSHSTTKVLLERLRHYRERYRLHRQPLCDVERNHVQGRLPADHQHRTFGAIPGQPVGATDPLDLEETEVTVRRIGRENGPTITFVVQVP